MQTYKIYINERPLILAKGNNILDFPAVPETHLLSLYQGNKRFLLNYVDALEKGGRFDAITLFYPDFDKMKADFQSLFEIIEAAGACVFNQQGELLVIYRRKSWDLPKGKIDPGESPLIAAIREVQEETGVSKLSVSHEIAQTWHTYRQVKRILKHTYWFDMTTSDIGLTPQLEEDIEEARWVNPHHFLNDNDFSRYGNIRELVETCLKSR
ncbi:MAG: NUDIX hydrolase [Bacteroidota bacterium]